MRRLFPLSRLSSGLGASGPGQDALAPDVEQHESQQPDEHGHLDQCPGAELRVGVDRRPWVEEDRFYGENDVQEGVDEVSDLALGPPSPTGSTPLS